MGRPFLLIILIKIVWGLPKRVYEAQILVRFGFLGLRGLAWIGLHGLSSHRENALFKGR